MKIVLSLEQSVVVVDLLRKYHNLCELTAGEVVSTVDVTRLEWNNNRVEITIPD